ncbi:quinone oxidoreductase [Gluconacetobacter diazotrophicus]|uniref:Quinone oxidoreductase n=1 Tax=Gluconacetobacter diazotrophicus TaxID=33996 RepID=A0A7W4I8F1_GLUDI|nr:quinone oxidoreductase [Gluconacetobacter diazotrophicus]MBB2158211.1 quinone oxidoreductase [Gluconacetobacter diazotrophicus]
MKAIRIHEYGDGEVLRFEDVTLPQPGPDQALIRVVRAGVNYTDVYQRTGFTKVALPFTLGSEGVGIVEVSSEFAPGTRVAWSGYPGAYAEMAVVPHAKLVAVPDGISDDIAASSLLQGITAQYLTENTYRIRAGETALVHAGAGGVGLFLIQLVKAKGGTALATVSTPEKAAVATENGADAAIVYTEADFVAAVRERVPGGVEVAYDSVGLATWRGSLSLLKPLGTLALFGQASGPVPPIDPMLLAKQGSVFLTRPALGTFIATKAVFRERAERVFQWLAEGTLRSRITATYGLDEVAEAHRALEGRQTTGKLLIDTMRWA